VKAKNRKTIDIEMAKISSAARSAAASQRRHGAGGMVAMALSAAHRAGGAAWRWQRSGNSAAASSLALGTQRALLR